MNEPAFNVDTKTVDAEAHPDPPEFGMLDVVEAFTAMRHESRGQRKETRELSESIVSAIASIQAMEANLLAAAGSKSDASQKLIALVADVDTQLTRMVDSTQKLADHRSRELNTEWMTIQDAFASLNVFARWLAMPFWRVVSEHYKKRVSVDNETSVEGLRIVLANLRRMMNEHQIERLETLGSAFDAEIMHAIDTVSADDYKSGHVAEQLTPAYRWQGRLFRFASVRVAK